MRLIANKPCSFGGQKFYIGDEIPENFVVDAKSQEKMGVITIVNDNMGEPEGQSGPLFTQRQVEAMIAKAVEESGKKKADSRKTVKNAAKEQADKLFSTEEPNETNTDGAAAGIQT